MLCLFVIIDESTLTHYTVKAPGLHHNLGVIHSMGFGKCIVTDTVPSHFVRTQENLQAETNEIHLVE